ncbi:hypothetical protein HI113_46095, partial [Corallococcus exiguus]|uniref:hypothetical protein n=1 Tax=Corallococcus exiguus TaxID=83462 RepID=UPI001476229B
MVRALLFVGCVVFASAPVLAQNTAGCRAGVVEDDVVSEITAAGEIGLRSERLLRLASIRLPDEGEPRSHALALLKGVIGQTVHV